MKEWWEQAAEAAEERTEESKKEQRGVKAGDSFLLVCEGEVTEPTYFKELKNLLGARVAEVKVLPSKRSNPDSIISFAEKERQKREKLAGKGKAICYDHVWAIIDADVPVSERNLHQLVQQADKAKVKLAFSYPCFEFWLVLHVSHNPPALGSQPKKVCAQLLTKAGYPISNTDNQRELNRIITPLTALYQDALNNTLPRHKLDRNAPTDPQTEVHLLIQDLLYSLTP